MARTSTFNRRRAEMAETDNNEEPIPVMQQILDNPFLLLFLGITVPTVLYILWGVMEVATIPVVK
ncbi:hypothetical protein B9N43_08205 [Denitratisoma sp. DHT3]|nr:hypothetical protein B9N43_08205 [Denitratisoma sp. DHT3]